MVIVIARVRPLADRREELLALLREVQAASRGDDGCLNYGYFSEIADSTSLIAVEEWRDMAALASHLRTPHVGRLVSELPELVSAPPEIQAHEISNSGPLPFERRDS